MFLFQASYLLLVFMILYPKLWFNVLKNPKATFAKEAPNFASQNGLFHLILGGMISVTLLNLFFFIDVFFKNSGSFGVMDVLLSFIFYAFVFGILYAVMIFPNALLLFLFARILGGKASFEKHFYLLSLTFAAFLVIFPLQILISILVNRNAANLEFFSLAAYIVGIICYEIFAIAEAHNLSLPKAFATVFLTMITSLVLIVVLRTVFGLFLVF